MKKIILSAFIVLLLSPSVSSAYEPINTSTIDVAEYTTQESLQELRIMLMKQLIALLQMRIQELVAMRDGLSVAPAVLGVSTTTTAIVDEPVKKRRGGGGGSSSSRAAAEAKETACRLAGDLVMAPGETKLAYIATNRQPVYASWAPDTTKELYNYLYAYLNNYLATGNEFYTHIPDYRLYYALQHVRVLETRFAEYLENKTLCGEEVLTGTDILTPLSAEILALTATNPVDEYIDGPVFIFEPSTGTLIVGTEQTLEIQVYSATTSMDTFNLEFTYDNALLQISDIEWQNNDISWFIVPEYSNDDGLFRASGAFSEPVVGGELVVELSVMPLSSGTTTINLASSSDIHRADNLTSNIFEEFVTPTYFVTENSTTTEPYEATLEFNSSPDNPDATFLVVDENDTQDYSIFAFEIEPREGLVTVDSLAIRIDTPNATTSDIVDDSYLVIDGKQYNRDTAQSIDSTTDAELQIFELGKTFEAGAGHKIEVYANLEAYLGNYEVPQDIFASVDLDTRSLWQVEGYDDLNPATDFVGTVTGETHTLFGAGLLLEIVDTSADLTVFDEGGSIGRFTIEFEATAVEDDFYFTSVATTSDTTEGLLYRIDGSDTITTLVTTVNSTADEQSNDVYMIQDGETQEITLEVEIQSSETGNFRVALEDLFVTTNFDGVTGTQSTVILDPYDFRTDYLVIIAE